MSYYSQNQYKHKDDLWFENLYFDRWFKNNQGPILDLGCATGNFVATHPDLIEGLDCDDDCVAVAITRGLKVRKFDIELEMTTLPANHYAGVYAKQIIEHLPDPLAFLQQIYRVLRPGGRAVILTPNCPYALNRFFWDDYTHQRPFTRISLNKVALDAGFKKIKIYQDFRCFVGLGYIIRRFGFRPQTIRRWQSFLGIKGLSLILEVDKD